MSVENNDNLNDMFVTGDWYNSHLYNIWASNQLDSKIKKSQTYIGNKQVHFAQ